MIILIDKISKLCATLCCTIVGISCTQGDLMFRGENISQGHVVIRPDQTIHTLPGQKYYFYNTNGTTPYFSTPCDGIGNFKGTLPTGAYRVIAANSDTKGIAYRNMENYETATAYATNLNSTRLIWSISEWIQKDVEWTAIEKTRSTERQTLGDLYSMTLETLEVKPNDTIRHTPSPTLLTRTMRLNFTLEQELLTKVTALSGVLQGVYPSVQLCSGKTIASEIDRSPNLWIDYYGIQKEDHWTVSINLLGICDPEQGKIYENITKLSLIMDEEEVTIEVDLTKSLSNILESYEGELPVEIPVQLNIELELVDVGISGRVESWVYIEPGGTEILIPM